MLKIFASVSHALNSISSLLATPTDSKVQSNFVGTNSNTAVTGWLTNLYPQLQQEGLRVNSSNGIPDTLPLTTDQKFDYYESIARSRGAMRDTPLGHRTIIGFRSHTNTAADSTATTAGNGRFDDMIVVIWKERDANGNEVKRVKHFTANTEPSAQYDEVLAGMKKGNGLTIGRARKFSGADANGDGKMDLGRLPDGRYIYERSSSEGLRAIGDRILKPVTPKDEGLLVDRDVNHDGNFDAEDRKQIKEYMEKLTKSGMSAEQARNKINAQLNSGETIYLHRGSSITKDKTGAITAQNTYSAGCQTFPGLTVFNDFWKTLGDAKQTKQETFEYVLVTLPQ